ncbi:hypothetical protein NMY22_g1704 [Coprinellus aureogranulatus]|nr:hypothetical protein NMY22_g1704 [Coprinellus aureogranulatus]
MSTSSSKDATKSAKKARTAQAGQRVGSRSKQKTKKRLPSLHEMPFDIFLEILLQVDPKGLINLARTNKDTRRALVNSNMDKLLWKRIREDSGALDPPPGWSEAKWIGFLFVTFCQSCGKGNATIDFFILKRLCIPCKKSGCVRDVDVLFYPWEGPDGGFVYEDGLLRTQYPESIRKGRDEEDYFYYSLDVNKTLAEWKSLCENVKGGVPNALSELQSFRNAKTDYARAVLANAGAMMKWEAALQERRKQDLSSNKENLVAGIRQRFVRLGLYKQEDIYNAINMKTTGICGSASSEVTDRTWKTWRTKLEPSVTEVRDARIRSIRSHRMSKIISQWSVWKESLPLPTIELLAYPQSRDLWYLPEVTAIREMAPEVVVEDGLYQSIVDDFPNIASKFISSKWDKLRAKVPRLDNQEVATIQIGHALILLFLAAYFFLAAPSQTGENADWVPHGSSQNLKNLEQHQNGKDCLSKFQKIEICLGEHNADPFFNPFPTHNAPSSMLGHSTEPTPCPGIRVHWDLGSPFITYPFSLHDVSTPHKLNYTICHIDGTNSFITRTLDQLNTVKQRADRHYKDLQVTSLSIKQASMKIKQLEKDLKEDGMRITWKETSVEGHKDDKATWKRVWELAGTKDVPALHRIFRVGWKYSWSVDKLLSQMELALIGKYKPYSFSKLEFDLAAAVYEIGGGAALYALHNSPFALPCERTVHAHRKNYYITISSGKVKISDILKNIEVMFKNLRALDGTPLKRVGITLMMDEIASDGRLCYTPLEDSCVGLCEHAAAKFSSTKMGQNLELIEAITSALHTGEIHIGQEILVVAFARNDDTYHAAMPVLVMPTCKSGTALTFATIIEMCRQAWQISPFGEALHGPLWSIASDGDPKRRPSLYLHCMVKPIASTDPLFPHLGHLQGLNLMTGPKSETHDLDYKHTFKRICKLLCTREGILVNGTTINKDLLWHWLEKLEGVDWTENTLHSLLHPNAISSQNIDRLLNPKDPQDVPRAIKLLVLVSELRNLDASSFTPSELVTHKALSILGEMLHALVEPFINPKMSLAEQITSLVKFAFMACALYTKHEQHFMPHHLYSDLQSMVKTAVFRVAHTLNLDPELVVLLCLLGDDVLEKLFGRTRMIGGHVPNVAVDDLCIRFASSIRLAEIYREHRNWEEIPERLKLIRNRDFDHLGPRDWSSPATKAVTLAGGKLKVHWDLGMSQAEASLNKYGFGFSFADHFKNWRDGVDLMRPIPGKKYPGISAEVDRSLEDMVKEGAGAASASAEYDLNARYEFRSWDGKAALAREQGEEAHASVGGEHSVWMLVDGKKVHKKTIVRVFMDPTLDLDYNKSTDRLLRVKCYSIGGDKRGKQSSIAYRELPRDQVLELDDLFGTLVSVKGVGVSLAIAKCVGIKTATARLRSAPLDEISLVDSTYEISGQILSLLSFTPENHNNRTSQEPTSWAWNGAFISLDKFDPKAPKKPKNPPAAQPIDSKHNMVLTVNGSLVHPLSASDSASLPCSLLPESFLEGNATLTNRLDRTYVIPEEESSWSEFKQWGFRS